MKSCTFWVYLRNWSYLTLICICSVVKVEELRWGFHSDDELSFVVVNTFRNAKCSIKACIIDWYDTTVAQGSINGICNTCRKKTKLTYRNNFKYWDR